MGKFKKVEIIILAVLVVVLAGVMGGKVFLKKEEPVQTKKVEKPKEPEPVEEPVEEPEPQPEPVEIPVDFAALKAQNPDVYAYIEIPGTQVSYPILQSADGSVDYLNTTLQRTAGLPGSIYTENINSQEFTDFISGRILCTRTERQASGNFGGDGTSLCLHGLKSICISLWAEIGRAGQEPA